MAIGILYTYNFKEIFRNELDHRQRKNSNYSLRAFARDIKISPSILSRIYKYGYHASDKLMKKALLSLDIPEDKIKKIIFFENCYFFLQQLGRNLDLSKTKDRNTVELSKTVDVDQDILSEINFIMYEFNEKFLTHASSLSNSNKTKINVAFQIKINN